MEMKWPFLKSLVMLGVALVVLVPMASAEVRLPHVFGSHMVLQRKKPIVVWGWAQPSEKVTVTLQSERKETKATTTGEWKVVLPAMKAGGPYTLTVSAANILKLDDIMIGEVWFCSGQSNMEMGVKSCPDADREIAAADYPGIRLYKIPKTVANKPETDIDATWKVCTPATIAEGGWGGFSAAAYYFGREIHNVLGVPVGLIDASWGGTLIEPWIPAAGYAAVPELKAVYDPRNPLPPRDYQSPTVLYNAMIHPLTPMPIRGAIWYQGESNRYEGMEYLEKMKALILGWRRAWKQDDFPVYYVQIAPYPYASENPQILPKFWEVQAAVQTVVPDTAMALTTDIGDLNALHPGNKLDVGKRLALLALAKTYGQKKLVCTGPTCKSLNIEGDKLRVNFENVGGGLVSRDGKPLNWFEIIDQDEGGFVKAQAEIDGSTVVLSAAGVKHPTAVRFGWDKTAQPNLMNREGLPAALFRAGQVPERERHRDLLDVNVPEAKDYQLVYDLDLAKAGETIVYDVDNRSTITRPFDRIAYFLELKTGETETRFVYVSMDAFTDDLGKIGVPVFGSGAVFQQNLANMNIFSNSNNITNGIEIQTGNIEFWPDNYGPINAKSIPNATSDVCDFGDQPTEPANGYGSMQIHNYGLQQTVFSFNHWSAGPNADLGIGRNWNGQPDWTSVKNCQTYSLKRLRVLIRCK